MTTVIAKLVYPRQQVQISVNRVLVMFFTGLLSTHMALAQTGSTTKTPLQAPSVTLSALQDQPVIRQDRAQLVFYRPAQAASAHPLRLYVADAYHATLFSGTYTTLCAPPGPIGVRWMVVHPAASGVSSLETQLSPGQSRYFRVESVAGQGVRWQEVTPDMARQEAGQALPTGFQTRMRRTEACRTPSEPALAPTAAAGAQAASK